MNLKKQFLKIIASIFLLSTIQFNAMNRVFNRNELNNKWRIHHLQFIAHLSVPALVALVCGSTFAFPLSVLPLSMVCSTLKETYLNEPSHHRNLINLQPLITSVRESSQRALTYHILNENTVDTPDQHGRTSLMNAAEKNEISYVQKAVARGAQLDVKDAQGKTALMYACKECSLEVIKLLIVAGARRDEIDIHNKTAFEYLKNYQEQLNAKFETMLTLDRAAIAGLIGHGDLLDEQPLFIEQAPRLYHELEEAQRWLANPRGMLQSHAQTQFKVIYQRKLTSWAQAKKSLPLALALYENFDNPEILKRILPERASIQRGLEVEKDMPDELANYLMGFFDGRAKHKKQLDNALQKAVTSGDEQLAQLLTVHGARISTEDRIQYQFN